MMKILVKDIPKTCSECECYKVIENSVFNDVKLPLENRTNLLVRGCTLINKAILSEESKKLRDKDCILSDYNNL